MCPTDTGVNTSSTSPKACCKDKCNQVLPADQVWDHFSLECKCGCQERDLESESPEYIECGCTSHEGTH
ncbi:hypothetical protein HYPSUDRAFT_41205 [Hypholoma sublateritium FD-334 SS-4]|uniref:Uncharacterized protein n=1 Tax=Hypholoma sublateritium (strain FD-334 SS-4) TaxID=945553 RepID=A0A0D2P024_HYPSF|nr:hypothetical protein HYPSUDRAFT_41205 [Hypholoma sublateritium FD-334 SS-4]